MFWRRVIALSTVVAMCSGLGACTSIVSSRALGDLSSPDLVACSSNLGSYAVPNSFLVVDVAATSATTPQLTITTARKPDRWFCLEFDGSPLAADGVTVKLARAADNSPSPFLQLVYSKSISDTTTIIKKVVEALFSVVAQFGMDRADDPKRPSHFEPDPFDVDDMAMMNETLRDTYGFCVVIEGYTFDDSATDAQHYCDQPRQVARALASPQLARAQSRLGLPKHIAPGLYVKQRTSYNALVYGKNTAGAWLLRKSGAIGLENLSPIFSIGVNRSVFAQARIALVLSDGALSSVCVFQGSEAQGFVTIPVTIINQIVGLPAKAYDAQIKLKTGESSLIDAMTKLDAAQQDYIAYLEAKRANPKTALPSTLAGGGSASGQQIADAKPIVTPGAPSPAAPATSDECTNS